jgi:hypothetical protein
MKFKFRQAVAVLAGLVILAVIHLAITTQNIALKYATTDLKIKLGEVKSKNRVLGTQVARKENLSLIDQAATGKLKMSYPGKIKYVILKTPRSLPQN